MMPSENKVEEEEIECADNPPADALVEALAQIQPDSLMSHEALDALCRLKQILT